MEPLYLKPTGVSSLWGGSRLNDDFNKHIDITHLAETWECSVHPDGPSIIADGVYKGKTLTQVLDAHPEYLGEKANGEFPLLVKLIDATENLSVQVHPNDEYAHIHEHQKGKTEMWYIIDAAPDASIIYGFKHNVTKDILRQALNDGSIDKYINKIPAHKNDVFYIPSGTIHAIGKGILLAEVQESSNVTYRFYDYDRVDKNGNKRELHIEKALDVVNLTPIQSVRQPQRLIRYQKGSAREIICRCEYFMAERVLINSYFDITLNKRSFQVLLCIEGSGTLISGNKTTPLAKGQCVFLPAGEYNCCIKGSMIILRVGI